MDPEQRADLIMAAKLWAVVAIVVLAILACGVIASAGNAHRVGREWAGFLP